MRNEREFEILNPLTITLRIIIMKKIFVYDLPTRIFHWFFAFLFLASFIIAETVDDDNPLFNYHMIAGLTMVFLLILRLIWGFIGTTYARFSSYKLNPVELIQYVKDTVYTKTKRYLSHNPASSYAAIIMFICTIGLAITGILMTGGSRNDFYEEVHEVLANLFLITVVAHLVGIIFHHIKHKDSLWFSMLDGKKKVIPGEHGIASTKPIAGILFIIFTFSWMWYLNTQYDSNTQTLELFGNELTLGEAHESSSVFEDEDHEEENNDD
jgi:cytochrome b